MRKDRNMRNMIEYKNKWEDVKNRAKRSKEHGKHGRVIRNVTKLKAYTARGVGQPSQRLDHDPAEVPLVALDFGLLNLRKLGIDAGVRGKYLPSVKMTAAELGPAAATAALTGEKVRKYRSLVMRIA
eukprot:3997400-Amphidinium_carterae.2